jgi:hypothetical protein
MLKTALDWLQHNKEWIFSGIGVAVMGGIVTVFLSLRARISTRARNSLRVNLTIGFLTYEGPHVSDAMLLFTVANPGDRRVQLSSIRIPLKNSTLAFPHLDGERRMPCFVEPGVNVKFWTKLSDVESALQEQGHTGSTKIRAVASDALGDDYRSKVLTIGR